MATLGDLERRVMELLWHHKEPQSANSIRTLLTQPEAPTADTDGNPHCHGRELATTTILTVLSRLEKKHLVTRLRTSRPHRYYALQSREEHMAELMHEVLGSAPNQAAVLARFIGSASPEEAQVLRQLLDNHEV